MVQKHKLTITERKFGGGADNEVEAGCASRSLYCLSPRFQPAIELYGDLGHSGDFGIHDDDSHVAEPVILGGFPLAQGLSLSYEAGYLFGLTDENVDGTFNCLLELKIPL